MTLLLDVSLVSPVLWMFVQASVVLALAAAGDLLLRRRGSASARHLIWSLALAGLLLGPFASQLLPSWAVVSRPSAAAPTLVATADSAPETIESAAAVSIDAASPQTAVPGGPAWSVVAAGVYAAGALGLLLQFLVQRLRVYMLARQTQAVEDREWLALLSECAGRMGVTRPVRLLRSRQRYVPLTFGVVKPAIVIPSIAEMWTEDRRRAVLLHELAHVARLDCFTQTIAVVACAMYLVPSRGVVGGTSDEDRERAGE